MNEGVAQENQQYLDRMKSNIDAELKKFDERKEKQQEARDKKQARNEIPLTLKRKLDNLKYALGNGVDGDDLQECMDMLIDLYEKYDGKWVKNFEECWDNVSETSCVVYFAEEYPWLEEKTLKELKDVSFSSVMSLRGIQRVHLERIGRHIIQLLKMKESSTIDFVESFYELIKNKELEELDFQEPSVELEDLEILALGAEETLRRYPARRYDGQYVFSSNKWKKSKNNRWRVVKDKQIIDRLNEIQRGEQQEVQDVCVFQKSA